MAQGNRTNHLKGPKNVQFCPKGHDTFIVGRTKTRTCNECQRLATIVWTNNHPGRSQANYKSWFGRNYEKARVPKRNYSWKKQGIINSDGTDFIIANYDEAYKRQDGKCKICGISRNKVSKEFAVDHNHTSGLFRSLLCQGCNTKVGMLESKLFVSVLDYLREFIIKI